MAENRSVKNLGRTADVIAPDGSEVRLLATLPSSSMAHFLLPAGEVSKAMVHQTVDELWFVLAGQGEMWLRDEEAERVVPLTAGTSLALPQGTGFQFRAGSEAALEIIGCTVPAWPGEGEASPILGRWPHTARDTAS